MSRITRKNLDNLARQVNAMRGVPYEPYTRGPAAPGSTMPTYTPNPECVYISGAHGGWDVVTHTGSRSLMGYHGPAREAYQFLRGMVAAYETMLPRDEHGRVTSWTLPPHPSPVTVSGDRYMVTGIDRDAE